MSAPDRHPLQPLAVDASGVLRFKPNKIVQYLLDNGKIDMNALALMGDYFSPEDREQFAQLIGYSHSGFGELSYVSDASYEAAARTFHQGKSETEARLNSALELIETLKTKLREPVAELFGIHPDDLK